MNLNVATFEQLKNLPSIGEHRAHAILDVRAHLDRDLTLEAGIPGDVIRSIMDGKLIVSVPRHDGELVDRVNDNNEEDLDGLAADFARQMKEVTLAALDRIAKEVERLSVSVQKVNERQAHFESVLKLGLRPTEEQRIDLGPGEDSLLNEDGDESCVLKEVKGTLGIHGGSSNHNMASDFRVSSRNENTDVRCMAEKAGGSGVLRHLDSPNDLMMVGGSGVLRHLDSPTDAMDLVEDGVGKGTCFCKGSPASKLVNCQDVVPPSPAFGLAQHSRNGVSARNGGIVTEMRQNKADLHRWSKIRVPEFKGDNRWHSYIIQFNTIMKMNDCRDNDVMVCKLVEALRGRALDYFESLPGELRLEFVTLCNLFEGRFGRQEPQSTLRSSLRRMTQRVDEPLAEFAERTLKTASDGHTGMPGVWVQTLAVDAFLQGCVDKNYALSTMNREPQTVDEAMRLMKRFNSHEKSLSIEKRVRTLAFEERAPVNPQIKRVQERGSPAIDVSELNDSIGRLTKLIIGMSTRETRSGVLRCFRCNKEGHMARYCKMDVKVGSSTSGNNLEKNS